MSATRVLVVDDHGLVREGIVARIASIPDLEVAGEAATLADALRLEDEPDVILADLVLPDARGAEVVERLAVRFPGVAILVVTMVDNPSDVIQCFEAGAKGYLLKEAMFRDLAEAIQHVVRGETFLESSLAMTLVGLDKAPEIRRVGAAVKLTDRELKVLRLIADGYTNSEIASILHLSLRTVEHHRRSILRKTDLRSRADLVRLARSIGLSDPEA